MSGLSEKPRPRGRQNSPMPPNYATDRCGLYDQTNRRRSRGRLSIPCARTLRKRSNRAKSLPSSSPLIGVSLSARPRDTGYRPEARDADVPGPDAAKLRAAFDNYGWTLLDTRAGINDLEGALASFRRGAQFRRP